MKKLYLLLSLIPLFLLLSHSWLGEEVRHVWFAPLNIEFYLKIDRLSMVFLFLTAIITPIAVLVSRSSHLLILALEALLIAFFAARDLAFFVFFWEAMLIPLYFLLLEKGVAMKFLLYMIAGSVLMIAGTLVLYVTTHTFNLDQLAAGTYPHWIALTFFLAFAVKTPLFPFHGWLPDTYTKASTGSTILLSTLLSKAGIYGFLRLGLELFSSSMVLASPWLLALAIAGVFYGALAAWQESDYKRLLAYSSFSHVNFVLVGVFVANLYAGQGAILQAFNHGITITALFWVAGLLEKRIGTTHLGNYGLALAWPRLCWFTLFFVLSSVALPGLNNFVGEILILLGLLKVNLPLAALLTTSIILGAIYMLRFMQKLYFGPLGAMRGEDIGFKEMALLFPLVVLILLIGLYPQPFLEFIEPILRTSP